MKTEEKELKPFIEYIQANEQGKALVPMVSYDEEEEDNGDDIRYMILCHKEDGKSIITSTGRQLTYDYCKLVFDYIDPLRSFVVPEGVVLSKALSVYIFLKLMKEKEKVVDDSDFNVGELLSEDPEDIPTNIYDVYEEEGDDEDFLYDTY